jgi:NAD(P)-dependent dehydrogenase (short-subunit alcohol dehydrogenase family)
MVNSDLFDIDGRVVVITGAAGLLGREYALAIARCGGIPVLLDIDEIALEDAGSQIEAEGGRCLTLTTDVTSGSDVRHAADIILGKFGPVWGLVNNVAANPPMGAAAAGGDRLENFPIDQWDRDIRLGLTTALECSRVFGGHMTIHGAGSIVNIASDLAVIAPDQRVYRSPELPHDEAPVKPVSYSVVKAALLGLTRYLATYWAPLPIRCNALLPGSVLGTQGPLLVANLEARIPLGRLATPSEYSGAVIFLLSDASAYMTGAIVSMDGGRSAW